MSQNCQSTYSIHPPQKANKKQYQKTKQKTKKETENNGVTNICITFSLFKINKLWLLVHIVKRHSLVTLSWPFNNQSKFLQRWNWATLIPIVFLASGWTLEPKNLSSSLQRWIMTPCFSSTTKYSLKRSSLVPAGLKWGLNLTESNRYSGSWRLAQMGMCQALWKSERNWLIQQICGPQPQVWKP